MSKKKKIIILASILILILAGIFLFQYIKIKTAKIEVTLKEDLTLEFLSEKKVSDFIISLNGTVLDDYKIDSTKLGEKNIKFHFKNNDGIKVSYSFKINIVDTVPPVIWLSNTYAVKVGSTVNLEEKILCGDNYDNDPHCYIEGDYDLDKAGNYPLVFKAVDNSGNTSSVNFTLKVQEPSKGNSSSKPSTPSYTYFEDVVEKYKTEDTEIGIDVSHHQGKIDFGKVKTAGASFVIIRVGSQRGKDGEYYLDDNFITNITEANKNNLKVGIYFYSYASSTEQAIKDATWVLEQIKDYKVDLPIAFDWEDWNYFNEYNLSFFNLTDMAHTFVDIVEANGYQGMIYSSKSYLESLWLPIKKDIWLAHYTSKTNYKGNYTFWQLCSNGKIDGIDTMVDINVRYLKNK